MVMNIGYVELGGGGATARIYYDTTFTPVGPDQPLVNGPRGWCLDITNTSGRNANVTIAGATGNPMTLTIPQGNPVTTGAARSRTATEMAALGFATRGSLGTVTIS